jgi:hypothetical protein
MRQYLAIVSIVHTAVASTMIAATLVMGNRACNRFNNSHICV